MMGNDCFSGYVYVMLVFRNLISVELQTAFKWFRAQTNQRQCLMDSVEDPHSVSINLLIFNR